jgi:hypothetical protein
MKWLTAIFAFISALVGALFMARQSGKDSAQKDMVENYLDELKKANKIDGTVDSLSEPDVDKRLRRYKRKK